MDKRQIDENDERMSREEILKSKFIERSYEKILANIQELSRISVKDYVIFGLLALIVLLNIFHGGGSDKASIKKLSARVAYLEKKLLTPEEREGIDLGDLDNGSKPSEQAGKTPESAPPEYTGITKDKVKTYRVQPGDALGTVTWKCYHTQEQSTVTALGMYNNLTPPHFEIYVDQELKVPLQNELYGWYDFHKKIRKNESLKYDKDIKRAI